MNNADLDYFCDKKLGRQEEVISSIGCLHEGNPFIGTLILTNTRLAFVRKAMPGFEVLSVKSSLIVGIDQQIDRGLDFILLIALEKFAHKFELRAIDMASKQSFVDLVKEQFNISGVIPNQQQQPSTGL